MSTVGDVKVEPVPDERLLATRLPLEAELPTDEVHQTKWRSRAITPPLSPVFEFPVPPNQL